MEWPVVIVVAVVLVLAYVWWLSRRVARLNARTAAALTALDDQLSRRASAAGALTGPAAARARAAAATALTSGRPDSDTRQGAENDLVRELRQLDPRVADVSALLAESRRLGVARQVYNDAVRDTRALRTARIPRAFRLGGRGRLPAYFDVDEIDFAHVLAHHPVSGPEPGADGPAPEAPSGEVQPVAGSPDGARAGADRAAPVADRAAEPTA